MSDMQLASASRFGVLYEKAYGAICGRHPNFRGWHFHWLAVKDLYHDLQTVLPQLRGRVLDVGCGDKPYSVWMTGVQEHVGADVAPGAHVDVVITPGQPWPFESATFDAVVCTQVMEHAQDLSNVIAEMHRVLVPGGTLLVTVPFAYNEHGAPADYRRFSVHGVRDLFAGDYELLQLKPQGGIGSTAGLLLLNWAEASLNASRGTRLIKGVLLPFWVVSCALVNMVGWAFDKVDRTGAFYSNVLLMARKN
ncbi:MAG TPA: class I SAM-dependent methyltransferase [Longimicrobiales bacterium]